LLSTFVDFSKATFYPARETSPSGNDRLDACLVRRVSVHRRDGVRWLSANAWRSGREKRGLNELKKAKETLDQAVIQGAASSIAALVEEIFGPHATDAITCIPCGHSRRIDCFGKRLAMSAADLLKLRFVQVFADRPTSGSSHPKARSGVSPLRQVAEPLPRSVIVVDDLVTSGWHVQEVLVTLRHSGVRASAVAWISGTVRGQATDHSDMCGGVRAQRPWPRETANGAVLW
jgi:hypothetical protein